MAGVRKSGVVNPYQYDPCVDCGGPARRYKGGHGRCRSCEDARRAYLHGSESGYTAGCRCEPCRAAHTEARARRRAAMSDEQRAAVRERDRARKRRRAAA